MNKIIGEDRCRLWIYGMRDTYTPLYVNGVERGRSYKTDDRTVKLPVTAFNLSIGEISLQVKENSKRT